MEEEETLMLESPEVDGGTPVSGTLGRGLGGVSLDNLAFAFLKNMFIINLYLYMFLVEV